MMPCAAMRTPGSEGRGLKVQRSVAFFPKVVGCFFVELWGWHIQLAQQRRNREKKYEICPHVIPSENPRVPPRARAHFRRRSRCRRAAQNRPNRLPNTGSPAFGSILSALKGAATFPYSCGKVCVAPCSGAAPQSALFAHLHRCSPLQRSPMPRMRAACVPLTPPRDDTGVIHVSCCYV